MRLMRSRFVLWSKGCAVAFIALLVGVIFLLSPAEADFIGPTSQARFGTHMDLLVIAGTQSQSRSAGGPLILRASETNTFSAGRAQGSGSASGDAVSPSLKARAASIGGASVTVTNEFWDSARLFGTCPLSPDPTDLAPCIEFQWSVQGTLFASGTGGLIGTATIFFQPYINRGFEPPGGGALGIGGQVVNETTSGCATNPCTKPVSASGSFVLSDAGTLPFRDGSTVGWGAFLHMMASSAVIPPTHPFDSNGEAIFDGVGDGARLVIRSRHPNVTIEPTAAASQVPSLSINDVSVTEGNAGTTNAVFTVSLSAPSTQTIAVDFATADGTAIAGSDYASTSGTLTFNPGETSKTVTVAVTGNTLFEPNKTFFVNLSNPTNAIIADGQGVGTIINDDLAPAVINVNESITVSDAPSLVPAVTINVVEAIVVSDGVAVIPPAVINVSEIIVVSDAPGMLPSAMIALAERITVSDVPRVLPPALINIAELIRVSDAPRLLPAAMIVVAENIRVNDAPTIPNTSVGTNVSVRPRDTRTGATPVSLKFSNVTQSGTTTLTTSNSGSPPPSGFSLGIPATYYNLTTTALFTGPVEVCIDYSGINFKNELRLRLFHFEDTNGDTIADAWVDHTVSLDTVKNIICASVTSLSPFAIFERESRPVITVTNQEDNTITFIDPETNEVVSTVEVGHKPAAASFFDVLFDGFSPPVKLYVAERDNREDDDRREGRGRDDEDDDNDKAKGTVQVLVGPATPTDANAFDFALGKTVSVGKRPEALVLKPDGTQVWVANRNDDSISIIDRATDAVIRTVPLKIIEPSKGKGKAKEKEIGRRPVALAFSPDGRYAYVVGRNSNNLIVIDSGTAAIVASIEVGNKPVALGVDPAGKLVYVVNRSGGNVAVVDVSSPGTPVLRAWIRVGQEPEGIALLSDGTKLYVTNSESNTVSVLQVLSGSPYLTILATIPVGEKPSGIAVTRPGSFVGGDFIYVANQEDNTVSVIDATIDQVIATIPVSKGPKGVAAGLVPTAP